MSTTRDYTASERAEILFNFYNDQGNKQPNRAFEGRVPKATDAENIAEQKKQVSELVAQDAKRFYVPLADHIQKDDQLLNDNGSKKSFDIFNGKTDEIFKMIFDALNDSRFANLDPKDKLELANSYMFALSGEAGSQVAEDEKRSIMVRGAIAGEFQKSVLKLQ